MNSSDMKSSDMKSSDMKSSDMLLGFLKGVKRYFVLALLFICSASLADMLRPRIIAYTIDTILGDAPSSLNPGALGRHLWLPALAVILCTLVSVILNYFYQMSIARGGETFVKQMRDQLFAHLEKLPVLWHSQHSTGDIIQRCTNDVEEIKAFLSDQLVNLIRMIITIALVLVFMFRISWRLSLVALASVPLLFCFSLWFHGRIGRAFQECDENESDLSSIAQENLTGVRVVRAFGRENQETQRFAKQNQIVTTSWIALGKNFAYYFSISDIMTGVIMLTILTWGSSMCIHEQLSVGSLLALITYLTMLTRPVRGLGRVLSEMSKTTVSVKRLHEIMSAEPETDPASATEPPMNRDIVFNHVNYAFPGQPQLLHDLSFKIPAGSTLGILGSTGSGKSTIAHLLARLYDLPAKTDAPDGRGCGSITVGGEDIRRMKRSWVRKNVGFVLQEPFLFSRSIAENLAITQEGSGPASEEELRRAARTACLEKSIDDFPRGFDTFVGERGVTLSGGQKQRAAIARTLMGHSPILIFDDSLSAVDAETDAMIRDNLLSDHKGSTKIIISHRITTLMEADQILVLENGRITACGTHEELIEQEGLYRKIYLIQSGKEGAQNDAE